MFLQLQSTIGRSDYVRRDQALKRLIQPLAGEYGMHNGEPQGEPAPHAPIANVCGPRSIHTASQATVSLGRLQCVAIVHYN